MSTGPGHKPLTMVQGDTFRLPLAWGLRGTTAVPAPSGAPSAPPQATIYHDVTANLFYVYKGTSWYLFTPTNLTGYTAKLQIRATPESGTVLLELSTSNGGITLGGAAGAIAILATATQTAALDFTEAQYSLKLTAGSGGDARTLLDDVVVLKRVPAR